MALARSDSSTARALLAPVVEKGSFVHGERVEALPPFAHVEVACGALAAARAAVAGPWKRPRRRTNDGPWLRRRAG